VLWIIHPLRVQRNLGATNTKETSETLTIREKPCLNHPHRDPETHVGCWVWQPRCAKRRSATGIVIQVYQDNPRRQTSSLVIAVKPLSKMSFAVLAMNWAGCGPDVFN
jgi:hypothetical protein